MSYISDELKESVNKLLPYFIESDSNTSIVSGCYRVFQGSGGVIEKVACYLNDIGLAFKVYYNKGYIVFESGARLTFNRLDSLDGLLLDAALLITNRYTSTKDIYKVKSRLWNSEGCSNNLWIIDIDNT